MGLKFTLAIVGTVAVALGVGLVACVGDDPLVASANLTDAAFDDGAASSDASASDASPSDANSPDLVACGTQVCKVCCSDPTFPDGGLADQDSFQSPRCKTPSKPCANAQNSLECDRASQCPGKVCCAQLNGGGYTVSGGHCELASDCDRRQSTTRLCGGPADCYDKFSDAGVTICRTADPGFLSICKP